MINNEKNIFDKNSTILNKNSDEYIKLIALIKETFLSIISLIKDEYKDSNFYFQNFNNDSFIGANAISMITGDIKSESSLEYILNNKEDFIVCEKSDGNRYLMIILTNGKKYFFDRKSNLYLVNIDIPGICQNNEIPKIKHIFDGELVGVNNKSYIEYLLFDCLLFDGNNLCTKEYFKRLHFTKLFEDRINFLIPFFDKEINIKIKVKDFFNISKIKLILKNLIKHLPHENDGLIFTRNKYPYLPGTTSGILKWKPEKLNTIDFFICENLDILKNNSELHLGNFKDFFIFEIYTYFKGELILFDYLFVFSEEEFEKLIMNSETIELNNIKYEGSICELSFIKDFKSEKMDLFYKEFVDYDSDKILELIDNSKINKDFSKEKKNDIMIDLWENLNRRLNDKNEVIGNWSFLRNRNDKGYPNSLKVAKNTIDIIFNIGINEDDLIDKVNFDLNIQ